MFDTYDLYERGSGSKLNLSKSTGLWLGPWNGRSDSPVAIDWSSVKIKVLGVFLGPLDLEEGNWRPVCLLLRMSSCPGVNVLFPSGVRRLLLMPWLYLVFGILLP